MKMHVFLFSLILILPLIALRQGWTQTKQGPHAPVIIHTYAEDRGPYGIIWKIYMEAEDTDADMDYIVVVVNQPGQGSYPPDRILLDPRHRNHLKGFLQWNTFSSKAGSLDEGTRITVRISIIDKLGNESKEAVFPFTFGSGLRGQDKVPLPFSEDVPRIGYIGVDLVGSTQ